MYFIELRLSYTVRINQTIRNYFIFYHIKNEKITVPQTSLTYFILFLALLWNTPLTLADNRVEKVSNYIIYL